MTTLATARTLLRRRLEDASGTPLWSDALLGDALAAALNEYSQWSRQQGTTTFTASAGQLNVALPPTAREVVRVSDSAGRIYPRATAGGGRARDIEVEWEIWGGTLYFTAGLAADTYTIRYTADWTAPAGDGDSFGIPEADMDLLYALAAVVALSERAVQEWKRGQLPARYQTALSEARATAERQWDARRRRIRATSVVGQG